MLTAPSRFIFGIGLLELPRSKPRRRRSGDGTRRPSKRLFWPLGITRNRDADAQKLLGQAIDTLKPRTDSKSESETAVKQAHQDIQDSSSGS